MVPEYKYGIIVHQLKLLRLLCCVCCNTVMASLGFRVGSLGLTV